MRPRLRRPSAPMLVALLALFVALGGPAQAAKLINGARIKEGTVGSKQVKDRSLKPRDLSASAVRALTATPDGSITGAKLQENAITARAIAPDSIGTGHIGDGGITAADLGSNAVGSDEIADNAVGQTEIRSNGVGASEIADNSIDGGEIVDGGLSIRDVARQVGTITWPISGLSANQCEEKAVPISGFKIAGDPLVLLPVTDWPRDLTYAVTGTTAANEYVLQACAHKAVAGATYTFNYAILGF